MTIKYKELFGLTAISDEAIERAAESPAEIIPSIGEQVATPNLQTASR